MQTWRTLAAVAVAAVVGGTLAVEAIGPRPLPQVQLTRFDGSAATSAQLPADGNWLLLYVKPNCVACDRVLRTLTPTEETNVLAKVVVVVGGATADEAKAYAEAHPEVHGAAWYAEKDETLAAPLQINESPVILAVTGRTIQWSLAGVLSGRSQTRNVMVNWVQKEVRPQGAEARKPGDQR